MEFGFRERMKIVQPMMRPPASRATNVEIVPSSTWGIRSRHQAAASSKVTPARKLTPAPLSTAS
jgi:hypothetical protein